MSGICKKTLKRVHNQINKLFRSLYLRKLRKGFQNHSLSVFSSNCVGGCMLHDLGVRFLSPLVNLFMDAKDYLKFLSKPKAYLALTLVEEKTDLPYPVGHLGDLTLHFVHYKSFSDAVDSFAARTQRINYDNLFVIFCERDGCTYEDLLTFDALPYSHKVVFTHTPYEDIRSAFYISGYEDQDCLGDILKWDRKLGRKIYDRFDFASWLQQS